MCRLLIKDKPGVEGRRLFDEERAEEKRREVELASKVKALASAKPWPPARKKPLHFD